MGSDTEELVMNYDELKQEAEEMAEGRKTIDLARMAFVYSYIANQELRIVFERLGTLSKLVWGLLIVIVLWICKSVLIG